jgi:ABC-2 type transport system permease protein
MNTNTMKWLLRREFWENKGAMFWAPLVVGALLVLLVGGTAAYGIVGHGVPGHITINGHTMANGGMSAAVSLDSRTMIAKVASGMYLATASPLFFMLVFAVFFYCLGALYDERRDRSILFWKSLPVSDTMTVLSKAAMAMIVAPLITIVLAVAASLALLLIVCAALGTQGMNMLGPILASPDLYLSPLRLLALLPVYAVWALPTVGWLMLVSGWARSKPFIWAVGVPLTGLLLLKWVDTAMQKLSGTSLAIMPYAQDLVARLLGGLVPGIWFAYRPELAPALGQGAGSIDTGAILGNSYASLASADAWFGVALGALMLYGAIRLRRWRDEG